MGSKRLGKFVLFLKYERAIEIRVGHKKVRGRDTSPPVCSLLASFFQIFLEFSNDCNHVTVYRYLM